LFSFNVKKLRKFKYQFSFRFLKRKKRFKKRQKFLVNFHSLRSDQVIAVSLNNVKSFINYYFNKSNNGAVQTFFLFPFKQHLTAAKLVYIIKRRLIKHYSINYIIKRFVQLLDKQENLIGYRISFNGRFTRRQRSSHKWAKSTLKSKDKFLLSKVSAIVDYASGEYISRYGLCSIKV
jgi:hypothetical protein